MKEDSRPIGLFDSGVGGLTVVAEVFRQLPNESVIFVGDTAHLPYGDKSARHVIDRSLAITDFLLQQQVKAIVIACNTASATAAQAIGAYAYSVPVVEVIGPTVAHALTDSGSTRIGVIGTRTTMASGIYKQSLQSLAPDVQVHELATPLLVPLIEDGWLEHPVAAQVLATYLAHPSLRHIDTLLLGCTHYPLLRSSVVEYYRQQYQDVRVIDSAAPTVRVLSALLSQTETEPRQTAGNFPEHRFYATDLSPHFLTNARRFLSDAMSFEGLDV